MAEILDEKQKVLDEAVAEGGAYEILSRRLNDLGHQLTEVANDLNKRRLDEFGKSELDIIGRVRVRTENNCQARDIVRVGDLLLFGYNVFIGLKQETKVSDVFSLYKVSDHNGAYEAAPISLAGTFLDDPSFVRDFTELYTYYKGASLLQLSVWESRLLASFQNGAKVTDIRVFRWEIKMDGSLAYIDNRGERDIKLPPAHDFEWVRTGRDNAVYGRHPHINILDTVFVETVGGDLTVKIENNTEDGLGIYREDVLDKNQSLDDGQIEYAKVGSLILLKILPYRESAWRYFVYNTLTHDVKRIDAIGQACIQLPEDHGLIFPGGYYLQSGECKTFDNPMEGMLFRRMRKSPNGEDVLYVFYEPAQGQLALFNYNMIDRSLGSPILGNGYTILEDGRMIIFEGSRQEATRVHPMQIWATPFYSDEHAAGMKNGNNPMARIGNADLVRGISDLYNVARQSMTLKVSSAIYGKLAEDARKIFDHYFWMKDEKNFHAAPVLNNITKTAELVLDEYVKVENIRNQSSRNLRESASAQKDLFSALIIDSWDNIRGFSDALERIKKHRGRLISLKSLRYMDIEEVEKLEGALKVKEEEVARGAAAFMAKDQALEPFMTKVEECGQMISQAQVAASLAEPLGELDKMASELDVVSTLMSGLNFDDLTKQTEIIEKISNVYASVNQCRVKLQNKRKNLGETEGAAQFGAGLKLLNQALASSINAANTPEKCDDEVARLLLQLEDLETRFSANENFLNDILQKRDELLETFEAHKRTLLEERQRRSHALAVSAGRIIDTLPRRLARLSSIEELNSFFAGDPMSLKVRELAAKLREIKDSVKADDIEARFKAAQDQAVRSLRDKSELYEDGGNTIKLGPRHRFTVNTQEIDLALMPKEGERLALFLTGTEFSEDIDDHELNELKEFWHILIESESKNVSRAEYLAYQVMLKAGRNESGLSEESLLALAAKHEEIESLVKSIAAPLYREGYEKGIHDHDAVLILKTLIPLKDGAGLLRFNAEARALAMLFWQKHSRDPLSAAWQQTARASLGVKHLYHHDEATAGLISQMSTAFHNFVEKNGMENNAQLIAEASEFLCQTLAAQPMEFVCSKYARDLFYQLRHQLEENHLWLDYINAQREHDEQLAGRWNVIKGWLNAMCSQVKYEDMRSYIAEAAALAIMENKGDMNLRFTEADLSATVEGLISSHQRIKEGSLTLSLGDFFSRMQHHTLHVVPGFHRYQEKKRQFLEAQKQRLRLEEFKPRPLTAFVRNRLIDQVYLPIIGDNMAKQLGAAGEAKRSDLMGLLMLISPPGYGKTTLMEYVAHCLGLIFMKINGPSLGRQLVSLDPEQAPDATSSQELQKLNLALEMGNNVMLYIDDIQHTNPEFLQKFISLCDATRRIEGIWQGRSKTYDLRGKKFCVVMAGNPYTESGEIFKIPDMLANRADIYNLGEVLGGMEDAFALSYIENSLTSNPVLSSMAQKGLDDLYSFLEKATGISAGSVELAKSYSDLEIEEITSILRHLLNLRTTVMEVNRAYIASAAQSEKYRVEPPFKLQGSYRNMNKLAQQVSAVMNQKELDMLLDDMYVGEAQLLTGQAEENLLKLAEIRGTMTPQQAERWAEIKRQYARAKNFGGDDADTGDRVVAQLSDLVHYLKIMSQKHQASDAPQLAQSLAGLAEAVKAMASFSNSNVAHQLERLTETIEKANDKRAVVKVSDILNNVMSSPNETKASQIAGQPGQGMPVAAGSQHNKQSGQPHGTITAPYTVAAGNIRQQPHHSKSEVPLQPQQINLNAEQRPRQVPAQHGQPPLYKNQNKQKK